MKRLSSLDLLRFSAAIFVMLYHYLFRSDFFNGDYDFAKYGYLGVQLFFMISGFVIYYSIENKTILQFVKSRFFRLYPIYWICLTFTLIITFLFSDIRYTAEEILVNYTMLQGFFKIRHVDGVYWTLCVELIFYFWAFINIFNRKATMIGVFVFLIFSFVNIWYHFNIEIRTILLMEWSPYFISGLAFFKIIIKKERSYLIVLFFSFLLSLYYADFQYRRISENYDVDYNVYFVFSIISMFFIVFSNIDKIVFKYDGILKIFGGITYPLYLIHQIVGYLAIKKLMALNINGLYSVLITSVLMIIISYFINDFIENKRYILIEKIKYRT